MHGFVIGSSWVAQSIAEQLGVPRVLLSRSAVQELHTGGPVKATIIHADSEPLGETAYNCWRWMFQSLSARVVWREAYWVQLSTLRVLTGSGYDRPYKASDPIRPLDPTGEIMAALEWSILSLGYPAAIVRTGLLYSPQQKVGLLPWLLDLLDQQTVSTVATETVSPISIVDLCRAIRLLIKGTRTGVYHVANRGHVSYRRLVWWLAEELGRPMPKLEEVAVPSQPAMLALTSNIRLRSWQEAMKHALKDLTGS